MRCAAIGGAWVLAIAVALGCRSTTNSAHDGGAPKRDCSLTIWHRPTRAGASIEVAIGWEGFRHVALEPVGSQGWYGGTFHPPAGEQRYALLDDGVVMVDENVGTTAFAPELGGAEVTWVDIPSCELPVVRVDAVDRTTIHASFLASSSGDPIDPSSVSVTSLLGGEAHVASIDPRSGEIVFEASAPSKKGRFVIHARDVAGRLSDDANATVWDEPTPFDWRDAVIYEVMVDRFADSKGAALAPPNPISARAGGTLDGVRLAIESGELQALGVNTIWLSPGYVNPDGPYPGNDGKPYWGYHGYWPIASRQVEPKIGGESALDALIASAHSRGVRILFDVVPNHVHEEHAYWSLHHADGWFDHPNGDCICGVGTCDWGAHIQSCWFAPYLPDFDWTNSAVADQVTDDVLWWLDRFGGDGVRIDAIPMMPRAANRRIVDGARARFDHVGNHTFVLGETYTSADGFAAIRYELGPFGLDSEFDFPLMWALREAIGDESAPMSSINDALVDGEQAWGDAGAVIATMIDNHDVARFASVSAGEEEGDPWMPAVPSNDPRVYQKQAMALGAIFALPGAPVLYYGDEIALPGHGDPDARKVMPSDDSLTPSQTSTRTFARTLGKLRACSPALRRGDLQTIASDEEHVVFSRTLADRVAIVALSRHADARYETPTPGFSDGSWIDALGGGTLQIASGRASFNATSYSIAIYVPGNDPCLLP